MKHYFTIMLLAITLTAGAQYITPGTGVRWNLDSLANNSAGVLFVNGDHYEINGSITISSGDTIEILNGTSVVLHDLSYIESYGKFTVDAATPVTFTALDSLSTSKWRGFKFYEGHETIIKNAIIEYGGGIRVLSGGSFHISNSILQRNYYKSGSTSGSFSSAAVLDMTGYAEIINNVIKNNQRGAIASGSNTSTPLLIKNNYIFGNTTENSNRPQINMGPAGDGGTTYIIGNTVIGNGFTNAGGIAYSSLLGVGGDVVIDSNVVINNRYGITITGSGMNGTVRYNTLTGNNIQNNPDLGGSGINFTASSSSSYQHVVVTGNHIEDNLWGITIIGYPVVNMGNTDPSNFNPGLNTFVNNGNNGIDYDLYNNGPVEQYAQGNHWNVNSQDEASIETVVTHQNDNSALGLVHFMPARQYVTFVVTDYQMNPIEGATILLQETNEEFITDATGTVSSDLLTGTYNYEASANGYSTLQYNFTLEGDTLVVPIMLSDAVYTLTFNVTSEGSPVEGALINVGDYQLTTNASGTTSIGILAGTYEYTVSKEGYENATGTVTVTDGPVTENVELTAIIPVLTYPVTFIVTRDDNPFEGATINIADTTILTDNQGIAVIELENGEYPYSVFAPSSDTISGIAIVNSEPVEIVVGLVTGVSNIPVSDITIYPTPASDIIYIEGNNIMKLQIINLQGNVLKTISNPSNRINISDIPSGTYLFNVTTPTGKFMQKVIIK